jgi:hypothetical protein
MDGGLLLKYHIVTHAVEQPGAWVIGDNSEISPGHAG